MRIASFNINGVKARLPRLLEWLEDQEDIRDIEAVLAQGNKPMTIKEVKDYLGLER